MAEEAPRRLQESVKKIGIKEVLLKSNKRAQLQQWIDQMKLQNLSTEKKKVKNELRCYDNDFKTSFNRYPNHHQKQPFRPLYVYYKKLKEFLDKKGGEEMSQQRIQAEIARIKEDRKQLRIKIQAYQREFEANNNRRIRYVRDIQPIEGEYKKYKDLKNDLLKYEEMLRNN